MIQELQAGDRQIPASGWNEMRAAVQGMTPAQKMYGAASNNQFLVTVKNVTGEDLPALAIVKIDAATYASRTGVTFANAGISNGVEVDGDKPGAETDNIAILQAACGADGFVKAIASGCSPCYVLLPSRNYRTFRYAVPIESNAEMLKATDTPSNITILWHKSGSGKQPAYVKIDAIDDREYFVINYGKKDGDTPTHTPTIFTKGSLHYIKYNSAHGCWEPSEYNEEPSESTMLERPEGARLVVCQIDAPDSAAEYRIPYFTPESNMGVPPYIRTYTNLTTTKRCGVKPGEHTFTNKMCDYIVTNIAVDYYYNSPATYAYSPQFVAKVNALPASTAGISPVVVNICNTEYPVIFPAATSGNKYADIYYNDSLLVNVDCILKVCYAIEYPTDYPEGTIMPWYRPNPWTSPAGYIGRGWVEYVPSGNQGVITAVNIDKNDGHYNAAGDCIYVEAGVSDKIAVKEGSLCFVEKVKTNAIL